MHWKLAFVGIHALAFVFVIGGANSAFGQECPRASSTGPNIASQARILEGRLIFHDGIRRWFELQLDRSECGERSIQLVKMADSKILERHRGCRVRSRGIIDFSPTGYYSLDKFQDVREITQVEVCSLRSLLPNYSNTKPDATVDAYRVDMDVDYRPGDHPIKFQVRTGARKLSPWQAYASYILTGGFVLYGNCGRGFVVDRVFGIPEAHPGHFDDPRTLNDMAMFDPESAAESGKWDLHLGYTCMRGPRQ
jgi:hypothetical protein